MSPEKIYTAQLARLQQQVTQARGQLQALGWVRLVCFIGILVCAWQYIARNFESIWWLPILGLLAGFIYALARYQRVKDQLQLLQTLQSINEKELHLQSTNQSRFEAGDDFMDEQHPFSADLDVFGPASLYQHINRTGTLMGRQALAHALQFPLQEAAAIQEMQAAVKELAPKVAFRQQLTALAMLAREAHGDRAALLKWLQEPFVFKDKKWLRLLTWISPACLIACIIIYIYTGTYYPALFFLCLNWLLLGSQSKQMLAMHGQLSNKEQVLHKFAALLQLIKQEHFDNAALLKAQQEQAAVAGEALHRLARISNALDQSLNLVISTFGNSLLLYSLHCMFKLEKWKACYRQQVPDWLQVIAGMEAWNSLATFAFNHPGYIFPEVKEAGGLQATAIGHPLIPAGECVTNSITVGRPQHFLIITGSNMSGKSTFLRSVGSNLLLAMCGAPVCASTFAFTPLHIMTSMRIKDSIARHTSYFQAELLRLQQIVKMLQGGGRVFILLDEILKGTNSADKLTGSRQLITHLLQYSCLGMIATHDLELGQLEQLYPGQIRNYCFESTIQDNHLYFDYRIREGIAHNKNATFLMQQMGII
jgi:DNA mismatch repair ATPase MutS